MWVGAGNGYLLIFDDIWWLYHEYIHMNTQIFHEFFLETALVSFLRQVFGRPGNLIAQSQRFSCLKICSVARPKFIDDPQIFPSKKRPGFCSICMASDGPSFSPGMDSRSTTSWARLASRLATGVWPQQMKGIFVSGLLLLLCCVTGHWCLKCTSSNPWHISCVF